MKKLLAILLALAMVLSLAACSGKENGDETDGGGEREEKSWRDLMEEGEALLDDEEYDDAVDVLSDAIDLRDTRADLYVLRGQAYLGKGGKSALKKAVKDFETALELDEESEDAWVGLVQTLMAQEEYEDAAEKAREGLEILGSSRALDWLLEDIGEELGSTPDDTDDPHLPAPPETLPPEPEPEPEDVSLTIWVPNEAERASLETMVEAFKNDHPEYRLTVRTEIVPTNDMVTTFSVDHTADIFTIGNYYIPSWIEGGSLLPIDYDRDQMALYPDSALAAVRGEDGRLYGVPYTLNTMFMYYDKSVFSEEDVKSLDRMLSKGAPGKVTFPLAQSWYLPAFFLGAGCTLFGPDGKDPTSCDWNSDRGVYAAAYILSLMGNPAFEEDDGTGFSVYAMGNYDYSAIVSGIWNAQNVRDAMGDRYGAAPLPTFDLFGETCQMRGLGDYTAYAVNASTQYPEAASALALWLGGPECQLIRCADQGVAPCIPSLASDPVVAADPAVAALTAEAEFIVLQPTIPEMIRFWDAADTLGQELVSEYTILSDLSYYLDEFVEAVTGSGS